MSGLREKMIGAEKTRIVCPGDEYYWGLNVPAYPEAHLYGIRDLLLAITASAKTACCAAIRRASARRGWKVQGLRPA
jgi:hypothetical protein